MDYRKTPERKPTMKRHSDASPEFRSTSSSEWTTVIREQMLNQTATSSTTGTGFTLMNVGVMVALLVFSVSMFAWGTVQLSQGVIVMTRMMAQEAMHPRP